MDDESFIPAAHIHDVDLATVAVKDAVAAAEIKRLGELMHQGDETPQEFFQLVQLLHQVGQTRKAEYLLRRNFDIEETGFALYRQLLGTVKDEENLFRKRRWSEKSATSADQGIAASAGSGGAVHDEPQRRAARRYHVPRNTK